MNLVQQAVKQANAIYKTGAAMTRCNIPDEICSQKIELWDAVEILEALQKSLWCMYEDQYPEVLESLNECREIINEADRTTERDLDDMDRYNLETEIGKAEYKEER